MNTRILYTNDEGGLSIIVPASEMFDENSKTRELLKSRGVEFANDEEVLNWIVAKDVPSGKSSRRVDVSDLPPFRDFRNAWMDDGNAIIHDMVKANNIKRDQLREIRKPILEKLDVDYMRADEAKNDSLKNEIAAQKQQLRDVTAFADIEDVETLKDYFPDILKGTN